MIKEYNAMVKTTLGYWFLLFQLCYNKKWVYRIKRNKNGIVDRYKAHSVAKGYHQRPDIGFTQTFSPVVKPITIRLILSMVISYKWDIYQLNVSNAFLHGTPKEEVYMS